MGWYYWKSYQDGVTHLKNVLVVVAMLFIFLCKSPVTFSKEVWRTWWITDYIETPIWKRLNELARSLVGASKTRTLIDRQWVRSLRSLKVYVRLICLRCQGYSKLLQEARLQLRCRASLIGSRKMLRSA